MTIRKVNQMTRREAARLIGASAAGLVLPMSAGAASESPTMLARTIPSSGEKLPVIGLGTWRAFDVDLTTDNRRQLEEVLSLFVKLGGGVIDSSPMYGRAEEVIGELTAALGIRGKLATASPSGGGLFLRNKGLDARQRKRTQIDGTLDVAFAHETNRSDAGAQPARCPHASGDVA
jgi:hypothetical protein